MHLGSSLVSSLPKELSLPHSPTLSPTPSPAFPKYKPQSLPLNSTEPFSSSLPQSLVLSDLDFYEEGEGGEEGEGETRSVDDRPLSAHERAHLNTDGLIGPGSASKRGKAPVFAKPRTMRKKGPTSSSSSSSSVASATRGTVRALTGAKGKTANSNTNPKAGRSSSSAPVSAPPPARPRVVDSNVNVRDATGRTPLFYAVEHGHTRVTLSLSLSFLLLVQKFVYFPLFPACCFSLRSRR